MGWDGGQRHFSSAHHGMRVLIWTGEDSWRAREMSRAMASVVLRTNMRVFSQKMPTPQIMPSQLPNYWTMIFHVLPKQTRIASAFSKLWRCS